MELTIGVAALVLLAAALHATWNTFIKVSGDSLVTTAVIMTTGSGLAALALAWVPAPAAESWPFLFASIAIHNVYFVLLLRAYRFADLSQAYPIARGSSPLIVALLSGVVVGEPLSWVQLSGAGLVAVGIGSLAGVGSDRSHVDPRGVFYALACGLSIGAFALVDASGVRRSGEVLSFILWLTALECVPLVAFTLAWRRGRVLAGVRAAGWKGPVGGVLVAGAYAMILWAYANGPVAPVAALRETSVVMAALIGALRLGEPFGLRRVVAAAVVVLGVGLLNRSGCAAKTTRGQRIAPPPSRSRLPGRRARRQSGAESLGAFARPESGGPSLHARVVDGDVMRKRRTNHERAAGPPESVKNRGAGLSRRSDARAWREGCLAGALTLLRSHDHAMRGITPPGGSRSRAPCVAGSAAPAS